MIQTLIGTLSLLGPFILVFCFKDKRKGFLNVFIALSAYIIVVSLITQTFHIFTYPVILTIQILCTLFCIILFLKCHKKYLIKSNLFFILTFVLSFWCLYSVHYTYNGPVSTIHGVEQKTSTSSYSYPLFSDEWVGASFIQYSIESHSLPHVNPLYYNSNFTNHLVVFFSALAYLSLILQIDPISQYAMLSILFGLFILSFIYLYLRISHVSIIGSSFAMFTSLFILNSGNLPGVWFLIPVIAGVLMFIASLCAHQLKDTWIFFVSLSLSILLYPPIIIFIFPIIIFYIFSKKGINRMIGIITIFISVPMILFLMGYLVIQHVNISEIVKLYASKVVRAGLDGGIPLFVIWNIVPLFILIFSFLGMWYVYIKKEYILFFPLSVGLLSWFLYGKFAGVFFIEYPRVVLVVSILLVICAGFGFDFLYQKIRRIDYFRKINFGFYLKISMVLLFLYLSLNYTKLDNRWQKTVLQSNYNGRIIQIKPAAPITRYITEDDLRLFKDIKHKTFVAPPWKGLVIGVATQNYPLESKASIVSNNFLTYDTFVGSDCETKMKYIQEYSISYIYSDQSLCENFDFIGESSEGFVLYKVK